MTRIRRLLGGITLSLALDAGAADPDTYVAGKAPARRAPDRRYSVRSLTTRDADEQAENLKQWDQTYEQLSPGSFAGRLTDVWFGDIQLFREVTNQSVHEGGRAWPGSRTFGVPMAMGADAIFCGRPLKPDMLLTLGPSDELDFRTPRHLDIVGICVPTGVFEAYASSIDGRSAEARLAGHRILVPPQPAMHAIRRLCADIFQLVDRRPALLGYDAVQRSIQHAVLAHLYATIPESGQPAAESVPTCESRRAIVERARRIVLERSGEHVSVADLCGLIGVSRRTLQYCFESAFDVSPAQYLRAIRLNGARRDLKIAGESANVQDIAARWGFWHLSHFAADYRRMFGELPSRTLRRRGAPFDEAEGRGAAHAD